MIKPKPYKSFLSVIICFIALGIGVPAHAQLLDSITYDTVPTYTLKQALKQDPLNVYKLKIKQAKLTELPQEIYQFKNLNYLDISKNKLKTFPTRISEFPYLQYLNISVNKIEIITKELGSLIHLREFIANQNHIVSLPSEIKYLTKLEYLDVWGNDLGALPIEIKALRNTLKEIDMRVILMSKNEHEKIKELLPETKIKFSKACNCGF